MTDGVVPVFFCSVQGVTSDGVRAVLSGDAEVQRCEISC